MPTCYALSLDYFADESRNSLWGKVYLALVCPARPWRATGQKGLLPGGRLIGWRFPCRLACHAVMRMPEAQSRWGRTDSTCSLTAVNDRWVIVIATGPLTWLPMVADTL
jgi:hypothetical protein